MMPLPAAVVYALRHTRGSGQRSEHSEGDRVSEESRGLGASGDVIGALSDRVSELTKRVGSLESELDAARKRVAVYEEFDATVRDALSGALRGVFTELLEDIRRQAGTVADAAREANAAAAQAKTAQEQARAAQEEARRALEAQRAAEADRASEAARVAEQAQRATEEAT